MTNAYRWVAWNRHKKIYDAALASLIALYLAAYIAITLLAAGPGARPDILLPTALIRALGSAAILLLHLILAIGPLHRLTPRVAPLLYNRRHLGVTMFLLALAHAAAATIYYGAFGPSPNPLFQVLFVGRDFASLHAFPYEFLGFVALAWLFLMAATSHDFWLHTLSPSLWKALHMGVYVAYALLVGHVALGAMADDPSRLTPALLGLGALALGVLHITAAVREVASDSAAPAPSSTPSPSTPAPDNDDPAAHPHWIRAADIADIPEARAKVVPIRCRERVAIFRHQGALHAVTNVCAHQAGPLGEGAIIDGCITCPWHGYQFRPHDGASPPPYTEKIATYNLRLQGRDVMLDTRPNPPGTPTPPLVIPADLDDSGPLFDPPQHLGPSATRPSPAENTP